MRRLHGLTVATILAALAALPAAPAEAQLIDHPYQFPRSTGSVDIGMSPAYRQAILRAEIDDVHPDDLIRGVNGALFEVERRHGQAFIRIPNGSVIPSASIVRGLGRGGNVVRLGGGDGGGSSGYRPYYEIPTPMYYGPGSVLALAGAGGFAPPMGAHSRYSASIDGWIAILASFP